MRHAALLIGSVLFLAINAGAQVNVANTDDTFSQVPAITVNTNGFMYSLVYYVKDWFGLDGEFNATHLNELNTGGWFLMGGGGPRFRWSGPRGIELWGHALGGYSH